MSKSQQVSRVLFRALQGTLKQPKQVLIRYISMDTQWPVQASIRKKLTDSFQPSHLDVINESFMHNVPRGSETHFKVVVVSNRFEQESLLKRHRLINEVLQEELQGSVHALSIQAKTPLQWSQNASPTQSPPCLGGMAREKTEHSEGR
ncbi:DNA-binding transcriptional regulator BolA-like [Asterias amurensis]